MCTRWHSCGQRSSRVWLSYLGTLLLVPLHNLCISATLSTNLTHPHLSCVPQPISYLGTRLLVDRVSGLAFLPLAADPHGLDAGAPLAQRLARQAAAQQAAAHGAPDPTRPEELHLFGR